MTRPGGGEMPIHPNKNWRILSVMGLALAMSGLAIQTAHAMPADQGPFGTKVGQGSVPVDSRPLALPIHGAVSTPVDSRPIVTNTPVVDATPLPTTSSDGFNWGDASLGALSAF